MQVAFLTELFPKLSETFILNQAKGLIDEGYDLEIFADRPADEPKRHAIVDEYNLVNQTTYVRKPTTYAGAAARTLKTIVSHPHSTLEVVLSLKRGETGATRIANIDRFLDCNDPEYDVYHAHFGNVGRNWDFLRMRRLLADQIPDARFVVSFYGLDASRVLVANPDAYETLFQIADVLTVLSEDMRQDLIDQGCPQEKTVIQPLAIDMSNFQFKPRTFPKDGPIEILTVARFDEKKGLRYAIDAVEPLVREYDVKFSIAGDGPLFEQIEDRIQQKGIGDSVNLLGWMDQSEVQRLYDRSHLFLLPSITAKDGSKEGTPTVLLEAQACGLPVVSTYHAGIPEIVDDGKSGYLVPERNVDALESALRELVEHPDQWSELGRHGRSLVQQRHSIPAMVRRLGNIYVSENSGLN